MPGRATIDSVEPGTELEEHTEGIALFSCSGKCYGSNLHSLTQEITPKLTNYGESINLTSHGDCLDLVIDCSADENREIIENSVWLVDCECLLDDNILPHMRQAIRTTFPFSGNALIWVDDSRHTITDSEKEGIESISTKTKVVYKKTDLVEKIVDYLEYAANPYFRSGNIVDWRNEVNGIQRTLG